VAASDHVDDREPEPAAAAAARRVAAREALERVGDERVGEPGAGILDMQLDAPVNAPPG